MVVLPQSKRQIECRLLEQPAYWAFIWIALPQYYSVDVYVITTPTGCKEEEFTWTNYLRMTKAQVAPKELFASPGRVIPTNL